MKQIKHKKCGDQLHGVGSFRTRFAAGKQAVHILLVVLFLQDSSSWSTKHAALRLSQALVTYASKQLEASMPQLMGAAWQLLLAAQVRWACADHRLRWHLFG